MGQFFGLPSPAKHHRLSGLLVICLPLVGEIAVDLDE